MSSVLSVPPLLLNVRYGLKKGSTRSLRIVGVVVSIVSTLSSGVGLKLLEFVLETHD